MSLEIRRRDDIQGLRALAVLAVIIFHVDHDLLPGGFTGVDVFLVISGYLITSIIITKREQNSFSFFSFYISRFKRIVPAYSVLIVVVSSVMAILLVPHDFLSFKESLLSALYFNVNNYFANYNDYFAPASHELPLLHTWSLAVEMQFYLLLPTVLVVVTRRFLPLVIFAITALLFAYSEYQLRNGNSQAIYFSLVARIPEFLIGGLLALGCIKTPQSRMTRNIVAWIGLMMILGSFFFINERSTFPGLLALPACVGVVMLLATRDSVCNQILSNDCFVWIGGISYSLYLWHWPILAGFRYFFQSYTLQATIILIFLVVTFIFACCSYYMVEVPFRRLAISVIIVPKFLTLIFSMAFLLSIAERLNSIFVDPLPENLTRYASLEDICHGKILDSCSRGDKYASNKILLIGDSHAAQLNYFADVIGKDIGVRFEVVTASSCVPIDGFDYNRIPEGARKACRDQIEQIKRILLEVEGIVIAGKWGFHTQSDSFMSAFQTFIESTKESNLPVLVLSQVPMIEGNVQRALRFREFGLSCEMGTSTDWMLGNMKISKLVSRYDNSSYLDLSNDLLFKNAPFYNGINIYFDPHHLNEVGARQYGIIASPYFAKWKQRTLTGR